MSDDQDNATIVVDDFFGGCPVCGALTATCSIDYVIWGDCAEHKTKWHAVLDLRDAHEVGLRWTR